MAKKTKAPKGQEWVNPNEDSNPLANSPQPDEESPTPVNPSGGLPETPDTELPGEDEPAPKTNTDEYE